MARREVVLVATASAALSIAYYLWRRKNGPVVYLHRQGLLVGEKAVDGVVRFLGVPFASPPVGPFRWKPPQPPPWCFARRSASVLSRCPQPDHGWNKPATVFGCKAQDSEAECLQLNVWAPAAALQAGDAALRPVIFYIHGGAGKIMSAHDEGLSGQALAKQHGFVYVAAQYRLGIFGFLAHPALSAEDERAAASADGESEQHLHGSGNYAILDLLAALRWTQANARSFGGDPNNVTIWGLSTGSQLVATLLVSPPAAGLFHRAALQSCVDVTNVRDVKMCRAVWRGQSAEEWGRALALHLGCASADASDTGSVAGAVEGMPSMRAREAYKEVELLRGLPAERLVDETWSEAASECYEPAADRRAASVPKPLTSLEALRSGAFHRVPVLLGVTEHDGLGKCELEWTMFAEGDVKQPEEYRALLASQFGEAKLREALAQYPATTAAEVEEALGKISNDLWYHMGSWVMADLLVEAPQAAPVYCFCITQPGFTKHGRDTPLWNGVRGNRDASMLPPRDEGLSMMEYLANFATRGDPNGAGLPRWQAHSVDEPVEMEVGPRVGMRQRASAAHSRYALMGRYVRERVL